MSAGGSPSLTKNLRTPKVYPDPGNVAQTFRLFVDNATCGIADYRLDQYNRPASIYGGLGIEGSGNGGAGGAPACFSPLYRIEVENLQRPQYSEYLAVPQGLMMTQSEFQNSPHTDMLGMNRSRAFGLDGVYRRMPFPGSTPEGNNPSSDKAWLQRQEWNASQLLNQFDQRLWLNSADTQSGF
jgi:hypothetical protein